MFVHTLAHTISITFTLSHTRTHTHTHAHSETHTNTHTHTHTKAPSHLHVPHDKYTRTQPLTAAHLALLYKQAVITREREYQALTVLRREQGEEPVTRPWTRVALWLS